jgi:Domain of unknown function (DUF4350)
MLPGVSEELRGGRVVKRAEWLFPVAVIVLLFVGYGVVPLPRESEKADSFSIDRGGKRAFYDLASRLLSKVSRNSASLIPSDPGADTLVILGPSRYPDRAQWQTLRNWVSQGRALVFAAKWQDPAVRLESFGIEVVPSMGPPTEKAPEKASPGPDPKAGPEPGPESESESEPSPQPDDTGIETELAGGDLEWRSAGEIRFTDPKATVELSMNLSPQVIWQPVGKGVIIVVASDFIFSNFSLTKPDNGVLAFRILELASPSGAIYFDEGMNLAGAPRVVGVLVEPPFRLPTVQLLIVAVLFAWMVSRRFGPIESRGRSERRSLVEHAEGLGNLHFRVGTGSRLVASYLEYFRRELGLQYRSAEATPALESRGKNGGSEAIARALRAAKSPGLDRGRVAAIISSLAKLRAAPDSRKSRPRPRPQPQPQPSKGE